MRVWFKCFTLYPAEGSVEINCWLVSVARQPHLSGMNFEIGVQGSVIYCLTVRLNETNVYDSCEFLCKSIL